MTEFDVVAERPHSKSARSFAIPGRQVTAGIAFVAFMLGLAYGGLIGKPYNHPIEYLYPALIVVTALFLAPGMIVMGALHALTGLPATGDAPTVVLAVAISAAAWGLLAARTWRGRQQRSSVAS